MNQRTDPRNLGVPVNDTIDYNPDPAWRGAACKHVIFYETSFRSGVEVQIARCRKCKLSSEYGSKDFVVRPYET